MYEATQATVAGAEDWVRGYTSNGSWGAGLGNKATQATVAGAEDWVRGYTSNSSWGRGVGARLHKQQ